MYEVQDRTGNRGRNETPGRLLFQGSERWYAWSFDCRSPKTNPRSRGSRWRSLRRSAMLAPSLHPPRPIARGTPLTGRRSSPMRGVASRRSFGSTPAKSYSLAELIYMADAIIRRLASPGKTRGHRLRLSESRVVSFIQPCPRWLCPAWTARRFRLAASLSPDSSSV